VHLFYALTSSNAKVMHSLFIFMTPVYHFYTIMQSNSWHLSKQNVFILVTFAYKTSKSKFKQTLSNNIDDVLYDAVLSNS